MKLERALVPRIWRQPQAITSLTLSDWDTVVPEARRAGLLGSLCVRLEEYGLADGVPDKAWAHLESARILADKHARDVRWEVRRVRDALAKIDVPLVLLKGAAYTVGKLPPARGRLFSDIDILVPKRSLETVEQALQSEGWIGTRLEPYDQRYYRLWMHQLPPMRHFRRGIDLDVHHTIMPLTARAHPDPNKLLAAAKPLPEQSGLFLLSPADIVLHSATHLFHEGELESGLRDLVDLDSLLRRYMKDESFWSTLQERARELELERPLFYALRYAGRVLDTPVPESMHLRLAEGGRPSKLVLKGMDRLYDRVLAPDNKIRRQALTAFARWLLFVRGHYLRMPVRLLIPHLVRKTIRRWQESKRASANQPVILPPGRTPR